MNFLVADTQEGRTRSTHKAKKATKMLADTQEVYICLLWLDIAFSALCRLLVLPSSASTNFFGVLHSLLVGPSWISANFLLPPLLYVNLLAHLLGQPKSRLLVLPSSASANFLGVLYSLLVRPSWISANILLPPLLFVNFLAHLLGQPKSAKKATQEAHMGCSRTFGPDLDL